MVITKTIVYVTLRHKEYHSVTFDIFSIKKPPSCCYQSIIYIGSQTSESQRWRQWRRRRLEQCPSVSRHPEEYHCRRWTTTKGSCEMATEAQGLQSRQYGRERTGQQALCSNGVRLFGFICARNVAAAVCRVGFDPFFSPVTLSLLFSAFFFWYLTEWNTFVRAVEWFKCCFSFLSLSSNFQMSDRSAACLQTYIDVGGDNTFHILPPACFGFGLSPVLSCLIGTMCVCLCV